MCTCVWRSEDSLKCHPSVAIHIGFFGTVSLIGLGLTYQARLADPRDPLVSSFSIQGAHMFAFLQGFSNWTLRASYLHGELFIHHAIALALMTEHIWTVKLVPHRHASFPSSVLLPDLFLCGVEIWQLEFFKA